MSNNLYNDIIHIKTINKNKKGTIIFVHGFTSSNMLHYYFQNSFDINSGYDYIAINLPGHKFIENKIRINEYNFIKYVNYLYGYIIENNIDNIILIGHSMGGGISLFLTEKIKDRIKKIILVSAINSTIFTSKIGIEFLNYININSIKGIKKIEFNNLTLNNNISDEIMNEYIKFEIQRFLNNKKNFLHLGTQLIDPKLYIKLDKIYKHIKIPTLFLIGKFDKVIPYKSTIKYIKQLKNPNISIKTIDNAGHVSFVDNFEEYSKYLWWFINL